MKEDYVSYELAKKLKECGFDEPCDHIYLCDRNTDKWRFADEARGLEIKFEKL